MRKTIEFVGFLLALILIATACGYIKSVFPDKEKDYQFADEMPALNIPQDLQQSDSSSPAPMESAGTQLDNPVFEQSSQLADTSAPERMPVELITVDGGATRLRMKEPVQRAWRLIGKALSRNSIEIINRGEEALMYVVQYDPEGEKIDDGSIWDELVFFFGRDPAQEQQFQIRLAAKSPYLSEVIVLDKDNTPVSEGGGVQLLNLLKDTLNNELPGAEK